MCITCRVQFDTHTPNYTALYPMIPQSRYLYNNFTLTFNDETCIHTYRPLFFILFSLFPSLPECNTVSADLFVVFKFLSIKLTLENREEKCALRLQKELYVAVNWHY
jgi:hypothetical protein